MALPQNSFIAVIVIATLLAIIALQYYRLRKLKRSVAKTNNKVSSESPSLLAKTRQQLYREIARHESTEELLRDTQHYFQSIINSMPYVLIGVDSSGVVTHWNSAAALETGQKGEQAIGMHINDVYPELLLNTNLIEETIKSSEVYQRANIQHGAGSEATFLDLTIYPLVDHHGDGAVILIEDVTRTVRAESMLIQSEKMMSLGEMAAGLAHEINNPLAGILNNAQNIERRLSPYLYSNVKTAKELGIDLQLMQEYLETREILEFIASIRQSGEQAAHIVTNMLEFSRANYQAHAPQDLEILINEALELARKSLELKTDLGIEMPEIKKEVRKNTPNVLCSSTEIKQVLVNLIRNATQAFQSDEYGPPLDPEIIIRAYSEKNVVVIEIEDNGPGMPESVRRHIFEPFFTTKDVGKGTGLGLSVSYFIVTEHHQGTISVDSSPGKGTKFTITLPAVVPAAQS